METKKPSGRPFAKGNPGKQPGTRNRATIAVAAMLEGEGKALARKCIDMALAGDPVALRLAIERLMPVRKERALNVRMPTVETAKDHPGALAALLASLACGELYPAEAQAIGALLAEHRSALETADFAVRLKALEERVPA